MADDNLNADEINDLLARFDKLGIAAGRVNATMLGLNSQQQQFIKDLANGVPISRQRLREFNQALAQSVDSMKKIGNSATGVIESLVGIGRDLSRGQADFKLFSHAIKGVEAGVGLLGGAATGAAGKFAKLGSTVAKVNMASEILEGTVGIVGDVAQHMVNVFDDATKSFMNLSKVGGIGADGIMSLAEQFQAAGLPMQRFEAIVSQNSATFAKMGGTVSRTAGIIANELGAIKTSGLDQQLRNVGMSSEEIADTMISYADLQRRLGNDQFMDQQRLRQGTVAYGKELDEIARITGMSREQAQKEADAAMSNARFNAKIRMLVSQGREKEASELRKMNAVYTKYGMEKGFQDMATGFINTAEAQQMFLASNGQAYQSTQAVANGQMSYLEALKQNQSGVQANTGMLTSFASAIGDGAGQFGSYAKNMDFANASLADMEKASKEQAAAMKTPNQQTADLMASFVKLEQASSNLQSSFLTIETVPSLMLETAKAYKWGADKLAAVIRGDESFDPKERYKTETQKALDSDIKATEKLLESNELTAQEQEKTRKRLDDLKAIQEKALEAQKATKTAIEQGAGPLGIKVTDSLKADRLNQEVKNEYNPETVAITPAAPKAAIPTKEGWMTDIVGAAPIWYDRLFDKDAWKNYKAGPTQIAPTPATPAVPQDMGPPKTDSDNSRGGFQGTGEFMDTMRDWLGEAKDTNSKIDQLIAETKKNGMYTRNA